MDIDEVACGTGVFLQFFEDLNLSDEDSEQFRCQSRHLDILLCLCDEFPDTTISHIHSADTIIHVCVFIGDSEGIREKDDNVHIEIEFTRIDGGRL